MSKVLLTTAALDELGGVGNYYRATLPWFKAGLINVLEVGSANSKKSRVHLLTDQLRFAAELSRNKEELRLVHLNPSLDYKGFFRDIGFLVQAKLRKIPVIVFWRGWNSSFEKILDRHSWLFRFSYKYADHFIVLSEKFRKKITDWGGTQAITTLNTCVDDNLLADFDITQRNRCVTGSDCLRILFLGRIERYKGVFHLVDAFSLIGQRFPKIKCSLTIAGDGNDIEELRQYIKRRGLSELDIKVPGYVRGRDKAKIFSDNDIFCLPTSHDEGMPNSILEAMAFGMPIVSSSVGGIDDIFHNCPFGRLCDPNDPSDIAAQLMHLISEPEKIGEIALGNYKHATKNYLSSVSAKRLSEIYEEYINADTFLVKERL